MTYPILQDIIDEGSSKTDGSGIIFNA